MTKQEAIEYLVQHLDPKMVALLVQALVPYQLHDPQVSDKQERDEPTYHANFHTCPCSSCSFIRQTLGEPMR